MSLSSDLYDHFADARKGLLDLGKAIGDGLTLAAEVLCPRDHTAEERLRSWEQAVVAVEDEICDEAEADEDYLFTTTWAEYNATKSDEFESVSPCRRSFPCGPPAFCGCSQDYEARCDSSAAVSAAADPSPADDHHALRGAGDEGPEGASAIPPAAPSGQPNDEWDPIATLAGMRKAFAALGIELLDDADLAQRFSDLAAAVDSESDPGAVSTPAPGEREQVSAEDLTEHLIRSAHRVNTGHVDVLIDSFVGDLLADFNITRK